MIDAKLGAFLEEGLGIHIGTRDERLQPGGTRAVAVKVEEGGVHIVVYVARAAIKRVLPNLESNGQAAVVFGRPIDERSCQVKGTFVSARPAKAAERELVLAQWDAYRDNLERIGIPRAAAAAWITWPAVAIRLKVTALFEQTPGPNAGVPLG
jgi:hypothetical protein